METHPIGTEVKQQRLVLPLHKLQVVRITETDEAALINTGSGHKRFTTQSTPVVGGTTYQIKMWVSGAAGELRTSFYDETNSSYGTYNSYNTIASGPQTVITQSVTMPASCSDAQIILSLRNTDATGIMLDSVHVGVGTPPVVTAKNHL